MTPSSNRRRLPLKGKPVPHVALLPKDRQSFDDALRAFKEPADTRDSAADRLLSVLRIRSRKTTRRMTNSLIEFGFLEESKSDQKVRLSYASSKYLSSA